MVVLAGFAPAVFTRWVTVLQTAAIADYATAPKMAERARFELATA